MNKWAMQAIAASLILVLLGCEEGQPSERALELTRVWSFPPLGDLVDQGYSPGARVSVGESPSGEVLVAVTSPIDIRVDVWTSDGQPAFTLDTEGEGPGELLRPAGAVFLEGGLYVLDGRRLDIQVFQGSVFQDLIDVPFLAWGIETRADGLLLNRIGGGEYTWVERSGEDWRQISLPTEADDLAFLDVCNRVGFSGPLALVSSCYTDRVLVGEPGSNSWDTIGHSTRPETITGDSLRVHMQQFRARVRSSGVSDDHVEAASALEERRARLVDRIVDVERDETTGNIFVLETNDPLATPEAGTRLLVFSPANEALGVVVLDRPWTDFRVAHGIIAAIERDVGTDLELLAVYEAFQD